MADSDSSAPQLTEAISVHVHQPSNMLYTLASFLLVSAIWGITNPLLKAGSESTKYTTTHQTSSSTSSSSDSSSSSSTPFKVVLQQTARHILATLLNWRFSVPFLVNQSGSLVYYYLLGQSDISMAVPIVNSLTFIWTAIAGKVFGEKSEVQVTRERSILGTLLILVGVGICVSSKGGFAD